MTHDQILKALKAEFDRQWRSRDKSGRRTMTYYRMGKLAKFQSSGLERVLARKVKPRLETVLKIAEALGKKIVIVPE